MRLPAFFYQLTTEQFQALAGELAGARERVARGVTMLHRHGEEGEARALDDVTVSLGRLLDMLDALPPPAFAIEHGARTDAAPDPDVEERIEARAEADQWAAHDPAADGNMDNDGIEEMTDA